MIVKEVILEGEILAFARGREECKEEEEEEEEEMETEKVEENIQDGFLIYPNFLPSPTRQPMHKKAYS